MVVVMMMTAPFRSRLILAHFGHIGSLRFLMVEVLVVDFGLGLVLEDSGVPCGVALLRPHQSAFIGKGAEPTEQLRLSLIEGAFLLALLTRLWRPVFPTGRQHINQTVQKSILYRVSHDCSAWSAP